MCFYISYFFLSVKYLVLKELDVRHLAQRFLQVGSGHWGFNPEPLC